MSHRPRAVLEFIRANGASFFDDIVDGVRLLPAEAEAALGDLVSLGLVNSDSFGGLRTLLMPVNQRGNGPSRRGRRFASNMADAGRWASVARNDGTDGSADEAVEHAARTLLRRWGILFWKLMAREAAWLPSWRDIALCCRRLEARGEIRGGRFVAGVSGEQFANPDAVGLLREVRRRPSAQQFMAVSGADPLNLLGIVTPGSRLPSITGNRLLYRDGVPLATLSGGETTFLAALDPREQWEANAWLVRRSGTDTSQITRVPSPAQRLDQ